MKKTPEELELAGRTDELDRLRGQLAQAELDLATLHVQLAAFDQEYRTTVGPAMAELDDVQASIAQAEARRQPTNPTYQRAARDATARATESATAAADARAVPPKNFERSDELKTLFREAAKRLHPDLTTDEGQRVIRTEWMTRVNAAYEAGDCLKLEAILDEWQIAPDAIQGDDVAANLIRVIRSMAQVRLRLAAISEERDALRQSPLSSLLEASQAAQATGRRLLAELRESLEQQVAIARARLNAIENPR